MPGLGHESTSCKEIICKTHVDWGAEYECSEAKLVHLEPFAGGNKAQTDKGKVFDDVEKEVGLD